MADMQRLNQNKERILSFLLLRGPSLPVQVAKEIGVSPLFASAFLSELKGEDKLRISNMRVGSSPLYYLQGQEQQLEKFIEHLNQREREAFLLLKEKQVLEDGKQEPVVRVALRAIKDFAISVPFRVDGDSKLFWKYFSLSESDVVRLVKESFGGLSRKKVKGRELPRESSGVAESGGGGEKEFVKKPKLQETDFSKNVKDYLAGRDIEVLQIFSERKKDFEAKVRIDVLFGKQEYYLLAKDKKSVSENDFAVALQRGQAEKMPAILMCPGELNTKAREYKRIWSNLVKFEKLNFRVSQSLASHEASSGKS